MNVQQRLSLGFGMAMAIASLISMVFLMENHWVCSNERSGERESAEKNCSIYWAAQAANAMETQADAFGEINKGVDSDQWRCADKCGSL